MSADARVRLLAGVTLPVLTVLGAAVLPRSTHGEVAAPGTLALRFGVSVHYPGVPCASGSPVTVQCFARAGSAVVPGLGAVAESYDYTFENVPAGCPTPAEGESLRLLPTTARLVVAGKGEIDVSTSGTGCVVRSNGTSQPSESFTISNVGTATFLVTVTRRH
jgi:hypothetical protein